METKSVKFGIDKCPFYESEWEYCSIIRIDGKVENDYCGHNYEEGVKENCPFKRYKKITFELGEK